MKKLSTVGCQLSVVFVFRIESFSVSGKLCQTNNGQRTTDNGQFAGRSSWL